MVPRILAGWLYDAIHLAREMIAGPSMRRCNCARSKAASMMAVQAMRRAAQYLLTTNVVLGALLFAGCNTVPQGIQQARVEMAQHIAAETPGDYYIGRRYYKP